MTKSESAFLTATWKNLVFVSFQVPDKVLLKYLPNGTEPDYFGNSALLSLVAFEFSDTHFVGIRPPFYHSFAELNLRFYARLKNSNQCGVVFIKEICPYKLVAWTAQLFYNETFLTMPSKLDITNNSYIYTFGKSEKKPSVTLGIEPSLQSYFPCPSTVEHFQVERYIGYSKWHADSTLRYHVEHTPWKIQQANLLNLNADFEDLYGSELAYYLSQKPLSVIYAQGSQIKLSWGHKC